MVKTVEQPKLKYNSFAEPNRRREASAAFTAFVASFAPLEDIRFHMCADDIRCIVEMLAEERRTNMRRIAKPYYLTVENAEIVP